MTTETASVTASPLTFGPMKWAGVLRYLRAGIECGTPKGQALAWAEVHAMARAADAAAELLDVLHPLCVAYAGSMNADTFEHWEAARALVAKLDGSATQAAEGAGS
jgi:hypothetical protein